MRPRLVILDADGVVWRGEEVIQEAPGFIRRAQAAGIRCWLMSNNASMGRAEYAEKCSRLGLPINPAEIISVNEIAGSYLSRHYAGRCVFVVGSHRLVASLAGHVSAVSASDWLAAAGLDDREASMADMQQVAEAMFDVVFMGIDPNISYLKLAAAAGLVQRGAKLIGANEDLTLPYSSGLILPGNGSFVELVARVCKVQPMYLGKPQPYMLEQIEQETGVMRADMLVIGDRIETDIEMAQRAGVLSILVESGVNHRGELTGRYSGVRAGRTLDQVAELLGI